MSVYTYLNMIDCIARGINCVCIYMHYRAVSKLIVATGYAGVLELV